MAATANTIAFLAGFIASAIFGLLGNFFVTSYYRYKDYVEGDNQHREKLKCEAIFWGILTFFLLCFAVILTFVILLP